MIVSFVIKTGLNYFAVLALAGWRIGSIARDYFLPKKCREDLVIKEE